jgi:hypothetical protein
MPLHITGLVSRTRITHPEQYVEPKALPKFESVLKFNPNHGKDGKFSSGKGGGGTKESGGESKQRLTSMGDPIGTIYYSDGQTLVPTGKKTKPPKDDLKTNPIGTIYSSDRTLIPVNDMYVEAVTGNVFKVRRD